MTGAGAGEETERAGGSGRRASGLEAEATAAARRHERDGAIRLLVAFFPVPFVVLLFRLHMDAWHYYLAGTVLVALVATMVALDHASAARRDRAHERARRARAEAESEGPPPAPSATRP